MKKGIYILIAVVGFLSSACESYVKDINVNPNNFTDSPGELVIGQAGLASILLAESQASRYGGIFTDQFTGSDRQFTSYETYQLAAVDFDDIWSNIYTSGIAQTRIVQQKATESGNKGLKGVAQILEAYFFGEAAALFGDIPYSQAAQPATFPYPKYDAQKAVLDSVQVLLTKGIANVQSGGTPNMAMYTGAYSWAEVAHTLKARYYLIAKDYAAAAAEAAMGISASHKTLYATHGSTNGQQNMYYQFGVLQRGGYLTVQRSYLRKLLTGQKARLLETPGDDNRAAVYFDRSELNYKDGGYFAVDADFPLVSYEENQLILAEALARTNKEAEALANFNKFRGYLAAVYGGSFPATNATGTRLINQILEEKYCTLIGSLQVFHDIRRTQNAIKVPIKNSTVAKIPQRFLYAQTEINTNTSFPGVVSLFDPTAVNQ